MKASGFRALVAHAQTGDPQARADLVAAVRPQVEAGVRRKAGRSHPDQSYQDWVNDVWKRLLKALTQFQGATQASDDEEAWKRFQAWLRRIIRSVLANAHRHRQRHEPRRKVRIDVAGSESSTSTSGAPILAARDPSPSSHAASKEELLLLSAALEKLPEDDRELLERLYVQEQSWKQIADDLGQKVDRIKYRYRLIKKRLRRSGGQPP